MYTNCDGLLNKVSEFESLIRSTSPQVIFLTETKLYNDILNSEVFLCDSYEVFRLDRVPTDGGGGVSILISKDLNATPLSQAFLVNGCECVAALLKTGSKSVLVG